MITSITLIIIANTTGKHDDSFERTFDDLSKSPFCLTDGPYAGCIVIPQEGCQFPGVELYSGYSIKFGISKAVCEGDNLRLTMSGPVVSRDKVEHPDLSLSNIVGLLVSNGWVCPRFAGA